MDEPMDEPSEPPVVVEREGPIVRLRMNRPASLNALTPELASGLYEALDAVWRSTDARVLLLEGAGRSFMAGGDLVYLDRATPSEARRQSGALIAQLNDLIRLLHDYPIPTLSVVHGAVAGAGLSLMLACDYALAATGSRFVYAYGGIAAPPDGGLSSALVAAIGLRRAMAFAFLDKEMDSSRALADGLVNWSADPADLPARSREIGGSLALLPAHAFRTTRRLFQSARIQTVQAQIADERAAFQDCTQTTDLKEGVRAFFERRPPRFGG